MDDLTLDKALEIIAHARKHKRQLTKKAVAYAIVDAGGNTLALAREEKAGFLRAQLALNKAWGCFALGFPSRTLRDQVKGWELWFAGINGAAGGRLMPVLGGVMIRTKSGKPIGAMGVAGAAGIEDEELASVGIAKAGFKPDVGGETPGTDAAKRRRSQ
ncbi:MAG: heme-binding protein [Alphaproteobacteria bacterium]|nr:heme-binding protein [Alphaproteobacteria bacterium]